MKPVDAPDSGSTVTAPRGAVTFGRSRARRDQLIGLGLMVFFLACIFLLQPFITARRQGGVDGAGKVVRSGIVPVPQDTMRQLSAEFPRLTLSGFRGLLAPILWKQAEENKNNRQWRDLDTTYNMIAKIEPYFISVYVFNSWNQAYNLSAQWHGVDEKYQWVLEGLAHLYDGERYNPGNPDLTLEIAQMYFLKIANSFERVEYRRMWRASIAHQYELENGAKLESKVQETHQRVRDFILRPQFYAELRADPRNPRQVGYGVRISGLQKAADGKDLETEFPYGLSPFYFAYREYLRCLAEGTATTMGSTIVQAYPAMSLRMWCRDDTYYTQSRMREMFFRTQDDQPAPREIANFDQSVDDVRLCFRNVEMVAPMAVDAFAKYLAPDAHPEQRGTHYKHWLETLFIQRVAQAEHALFESLVSYYVGENGRQRVLTPAVKTQLAACLPKYQEAIDSIQTYLDTIFPLRPGVPPVQDRLDVAKYQDALRLRMEGVRSMVALGPDDTIDFSFLSVDTVER